MRHEGNYKQKRERRVEVGEYGEEWSRFRETILKVGEEMYGTWRIEAGMKKKWNEWCSEEIRRIIKGKKEDNEQETSGGMYKSNRVVKEWYKER